MTQDYETEKPKVGNFYFMTFQGEMPNLSEPFYLYTGLREFDKGRKCHEVLYHHIEMPIPDDGFLTTFQLPEDRFGLVPRTAVIDGIEGRFVSVIPGTSDHKRLNDFLIELRRK